MRAHLELHYQSEQVADEAVLSMYPSAIRRKVLRHLYLEPLRNCYLFKSCKPKFLVRVPAGDGPRAAAQEGDAGWMVLGERRQSQAQVQFRKKPCVEG